MCLILANLYFYLKLKWPRNQWKCRLFNKKMRYIYGKIAKKIKTVVEFFFEKRESWLSKLAVRNHISRILRVRTLEIKANQEKICFRQNSFPTPSGWYWGLPKNSFTIKLTKKKRYASFQKPPKIYVFGRILPSGKQFEIDFWYQMC